ncbi:MAG TPA: uracil-DNA glycosylase [Chloroflexaceae bacterium]|nr:uracil-DNA glycosylase [Chloroflexaceae bacterium]
MASLAIPASWRGALGDELAQPYVELLAAFVAAERAAHTVYPPESETFSALELTPPGRVRAVILGQDPYHGPGQAHGLAFSVRPGVPPPPSLINIFKELRDDLGLEPPGHGHLADWAREGVLLLNAVLTVRAGEANSHRGRGWERLTDAVIGAVSAGPRPVVFLLWGAPAQKKAALVDETRHAVLRAAHPSPLSARRGFFGSKPFSGANAALEERGQPPLDWRLGPV